MSTVQVPEGRYGRSADERADRTLKIIGGVLGVALLVLIGWFASHYVGGSKISAEVITFKATSDSAVEVHLEVRKDADVHGYCTLRSQGADGSEVGRADFRFEQNSSRVDQVVTLRTTARGGSAELLGCHAE
ncbi:MULTISPECIES: DUF4307 domain-containing protein [Streptomyces]|uniref:DUF4307 domain-containing protein n=1 Tax=Streptomyces dengpaensis TaxID=2049881 RepID=A0ABN5IDR1_9ACTN|nr:MULTISPECIES: DUF4307 domain-containing protein [Streptomyces]AVH61183.1 DUF4307 domain-containing protein [Streptomyces dengpaensis]PIB10146.1 hypothetical protein B1C81_06435 [Streptomyces sp. HG99]